MHEKIIDLLNGYKGKIDADEKMISITSTNTLYHTYNDAIDEKIVFIENKPKKVECKIIIEDLGNGTFSLDCEEKTCSIIGGSHSGSMPLDELIKCLVAAMKEYNFEKSQFEQLSLF